LKNCNGEKAIKLATKACEETEWKAAHIISTLAAAYAENGDFENELTHWSFAHTGLGSGSVECGTS